MIKLTFEIPDEYEGSVEAFLSSQQIGTADPVTGAPSMVRLYPTAEDYFERVITDKLAELARMYPSPLMRTRIAEADKLRKEVDDMARPGSIKVKKNA
jgi:hypothetical protein